jgi:uncharacterized repeat protein (TIGR01451 family)
MELQPQTLQEVHLEYTYQWSNGPTTQSVSNLAPGSYTVTITDSKGCSVTASVNIINIPSPTASINKVDPTCGFANGSASVTPSGGTPAYTYKWNTGATTASILSLNPGTYTVTVTDQTGCTVVKSIGLTNIEGPTISSTKVEPNCEKSNGSITLTVSGGTAPFSYIWSNGATSKDLTNLAPGMYSVTVTDANGCKATTNSPVELKYKDCYFDLALRKRTAQVLPVTINQDVLFTITVFNQGTESARNIGVIDYIPVGFVLSPSDPNGWTLGAGNTTATKSITGPLAPGDSATINIVLRVKPNATAGMFLNTSEITSVSRPEF